MLDVAQMLNGLLIENPELDIGVNDERVKRQRIKPQPPLLTSSAPQSEKAL